MDEWDEEVGLSEEFPKDASSSAKEQNKAVADSLNTATIVAAAASADGLALAVGTENWHLTDLFTNVWARRDNNRRDNIERDLHLWVATLRGLPVIDMKTIRQEIWSLDLTLPDEGVTGQELDAVYAKLIAYRYRVAQIYAEVNNQVELFEAAYRHFKVAAYTLFVGTQEERKANAEYFAAPFLQGKLVPQQLLNEVEQVLNHIDFAAVNLSRMQKERENDRYTNYQRVASGNSYLFDQQSRRGRFDEEAPVDDESAPQVRPSVAPLSSAPRIQNAASMGVRTRNR